MKTCPYCAEEVKDEAIVCRYCGRRFSRNKPLGGLLGILMVLAGIAFIAFPFLMGSHVYQDMFLQNLICGWAPGLILLILGIVDMVRQ